MSDLITRTARLVPYNRRPRGGSGYVSAFIHEPAPDEPAAAYGNLYIVSEVLVAGRASEDVTDLIIETFGEYYYNQGQLTATVLDRFETAVKNTNQELAEYVNKGNAAWIGKISCVIAVVADGEVHLAHTGSAEGFLYRGKSSSRITSSDSNRPSTPTRTFGSIASGELEPEDRLLLATPALIHHVPLPKLASTISGSSPSGAVTELSGLLHEAPVNRIGLIIVEITTPEQAALALRSEEPSDQQLGAPSTPLEAAKIAAQPLAEQAVSWTARAQKLAVRGRDQLRPVLRRVALTAASGLRRILSHRSGRLGALALVVVLAGFVGVGAWQSHRQGQERSVFDSYQLIYKDYQAASLQSGNQALSALKDLQPRLSEMKPKAQLINRYLANSPLPNNEPMTFAAFESLLKRRIDQLSGVTEVSATKLASLNANQTGQYLTALGGKYYLTTSGKTAGVYEFNPTTGQLSRQLLSLANVGKVQGVVPSATGEGLYMLTDSPQIYYWRTDTATAVAQTVSFGSWPASSVLGTYLTNLYTLSEGKIYKFVKGGTGYSPKSLYADLAQTDVPNATTMAVDGSVYVLGDTKLVELISGKPNRELDLPVTLAQNVQLRSSQGGKLLTAVNTSTNRVLVFVGTNSTLSLSKQLTAQGLGKVTDAVYDAKSKSVIVVTTSEIVRLPVGL